ncbi:MAG: TolC family protein [Verrucomicrobiota bacterium]
MKLITLFFCSLFLIPSAKADKTSRLAVPHSGSGQLSLGEVIRIVREQNPAIQESLKKWSAMKARVPQAAAWADLKISASSTAVRFVDIGPNSFTDQILSAEQLIPISGKNRSRERIAAAEAISAFEEFRRQELDVIAKTRAAYFRLENVWAQLDLNRKNIVSLRQIAEISRSKYEVGNQTAADVLNAEVESGKLLEAQRDLEQKVAAEQSALNVLMNHDAFAPLGQPEGSEISSIALSTNALRALILANRPEIKIAQARFAAEKSRLELAHRDWIPDPTLTVQGQRYNNTGQALSEVGAGISFNIPWGNFRKYSAGVRETESNVNAAQQALSRTQKESIGLLRDAMQKVETASHHVELFREKLVPQAKQAFEANQFSYESGKAGFLEWISAQRNFRDIEAMAHQHLADYQVAVAELESVVGADLKVFPSSTQSFEQKSK